MQSFSDDFWLSCHSQVHKYSPTYPRFMEPGTNSVEFHWMRRPRTTDPREYAYSKPALVSELWKLRQKQLRLDSQMDEGGYGPYRVAYPDQNAPIAPVITRSGEPVANLQLANIQNRSSATYLRPLPHRPSQNNAPMDDLFRSLGPLSSSYSGDSGRSSYRDTSYIPPSTTSATQKGNPTDNASSSHSGNSIIIRNVKEIEADQRIIQALQTCCGTLDEAISECKRGPGHASIILSIIVEADPDSFNRQLTSPVLATETIIKLRTLMKVDLIQLMIRACESGSFAELRKISQLAPSCDQSSRELITFFFSFVEQLTGKKRPRYYPSKKSKKP